MRLLSTLESNSIAGGYDPSLELTAVATVFGGIIAWTFLPTLTTIAVAGTTALFIGNAISFCLNDKDD